MALTTAYSPLPTALHLHDLLFLRVQRIVDLLDVIVGGLLHFGFGQTFGPDRFGFATLSRRPVWWDHNQGAAVMWSPTYFAEWSSRRELALRATDAASLADLARAQGIHFVVRECQEFEGGASGHFEVTYRNPVYCVAEPIPVSAS